MSHPDFIREEDEHKYQHLMNRRQGMIPDYCPDPPVPPVKERRVRADKVIQRAEPPEPAPEPGEE